MTVWIRQAKSPLATKANGLNEKDCTCRLGDEVKVADPGKCQAGKLDREFGGGIIIHVRVYHIIQRVGMDGLWLVYPHRGVYRTTSIRFCIVARNEVLVTRKTCIGINVM